MIRLLLATLLAVPPVLAAAPAPVPAPDDPATDALLRWCLVAAAQVGKEEPAAADAMLADFRKVLAHLDAVPARKSLDNPRFQADAQAARKAWLLFVHAWGTPAMTRPGADGAEVARRALAMLEEAKAPGQYRTPFLERLGLWREYYAACRADLETLSRRPGDLVVRPPVPPRIVIDKDMAPETLQDLLDIADLCLGLGWSPAPEELERFLAELSRRLEAAGRPVYAITALEMIPEERRTDQVAKEIARLRRAVSGQAVERQ